MEVVAGNLVHKAGGIRALLLVELEAQCWRLGTDVDQVKSWHHPHEAVQTSNQRQDSSTNYVQLASIFHFGVSLVVELPPLHQNVLVHLGVEYVQIKDESL